MHHEKKISMEDTWTSAELKKHIPRRKEQESDRRQHRGGESVERRHRDQREHHVERRDLHTEERRADRDRRTERDKSEDGHRRGHNSREDKERRAKVRLREDHEEEDRRKMKEDKERQREERNKSRHREERDKERRREERPREERDKERRVERDTERRVGRDTERREERQREERDKERREERDKERQTQERDKERREERDMERREERQREERDKERQRAERDKERREERDKERQTEERDKERREERDRERRREERDKERHREERNKERQTEERDRQRRREERDTERREERDQERREERDKERPREERERERRREDRDTERREEREKERREERDKEKQREERDKERQREERDKERREERIKERQTEERDKERRKEEKDMERQMEERDKERQTEETDKERRWEEKEKERQREERDKERREERVKERHTEERRREEKEKERQREERDQERQREHPDKERLREEPDRRRHDERRDDQDRRERHEARKHSREKREQYRRQREERERRHKERALGDETPRRDRTEEPEGERGERETSRERQWREATERHHSRTRGAKPSPGRETETTKAQEAVLHSRHVATKDAGDKPATKVECLQEYDDDFEKAEYEEDFEDLDEDGVGDNNLKMSEEVKAIQRAMGEENERVRASFSTLGKEEEEEKPQSSQVKREEKSSRSLQRGKFIDFVAAKKREAGKKVAMKQKKRSAEMLRLIDLDLSTTVSLLDLPPVSEYDMYIRNFGAANTKQAYVQWNEENADRDIQTEEVDLSEKWTQHPAELSGPCGDPNRTNETRSISEMNSDSRRLAVFLHAASQVMAVLLEEDHAERSSLQGRKTQKDALSFSDGSLQLNTNLHFLRGRVISQVLFSQAQRHTLLSVHMPSASPDDVGPHHRCTLVCVWNMWEPSRPRKILLCDSEVQCCCFSPGKATLVFAGTDIGSVELWDLREPDGNHQRQKVGEDEWTFRRPTFSTDAAPSAHFSSVTSVEVVTTTLPGGPGSEVAFLPSEEELLGLSFQLASLDENGLLNLWVVVQLAKANEAGSQTDLGLRPGGKVKLLHSSGCVTADGVSPSHADKTGPVQSLHLKFLPTDPSHFFIGNNTGVVSHGTTQGLKALPRCYSSQDFSTRLVDVTAIQFSPFKPHLFLVGCNDGSVRLHDFKSDKAVAEWTVSTAGKSVVSLQWSQTRPAVFCALDAASRLYIWDLLKRETAPVVTERLDADRLTAMAAFGDPAQQNTYSGIATAHQSGKIEMHYFTREFTIQSSEEEKTLEGKILESF